MTEHVLGGRKLDSGKPSASWKTYGFLITTIWFVFAFTLDFVETPIRFSVGLPKESVLAIGHRLFHVLNRVEYVFAFATAIFLFLQSGLKLARALWALSVAILLIQTCMLLMILDSRTIAQINGETVEPSNAHVLYIGMEVVKLAALVGSTILLVRNHNRHWNGEKRANR